MQVAEYANYKNSIASALTEGHAFKKKESKICIDIIITALFTTVIYSTVTPLEF